MTTYSGAREALLAAWEAGWTATVAGTWAFDNEKLDTSELTEWVKLSIHFDSGSDPTMGERPKRIERRGAVVAKLYVAENTGLSRLDALAAAVSDIYEEKTISQVWTFSSNYSMFGLVEGKYRGSVTVPFMFDEVK